MMGEELIDRFPSGCQSDIGRFDLDHFMATLHKKCALRSSAARTDPGAITPISFRDLANESWQHGQRCDRGKHHATYHDSDETNFCTRAPINQCPQKSP